MQLINLSVGEGPVAVPWLLDAREDELDLGIHGCGCGCSCSDCSCSPGDGDEVTPEDCNVVY